MRWHPPRSRRTFGLGILVATGDHPVRVWRVQNARGEGPYKIRDGKVIGGPAEESFEFTQAQAEMEAFAREGGIIWPPSLPSRIFAPRPDRDFLPHEWRDLTAAEKAGFRFGFPTKAAALDWLGERTLKMLADAGYRLVTVSAGTTYISRSGRQVAYRPWTGSPERWRSAQMREREAELIAEGFDVADAEQMAREEFDAYNE